MTESVADAYTVNCTIHIGDYVTLQHSKPNDGWLCSEGLLDESCFLSNDLSKFSDALWEVHVQNQYSAMREYKDALALSYGTAEIKGDGKLAQPKLSDFLSQLQRAAMNEQRLNEKLMNIKRGKPVSFGDPIQLRHVKSRKFLTISQHQLARKERENMRVTVEVFGDSMSCLGFTPRYKYDREGQSVTNGAECSLRVHERPSEFVHAAKGETEGPQEINCSLESSFWTVQVFQQVLDSQSKSVMAGQLITLQDPDNLSCLTVDQPVDSGEGLQAKVVMSPQFHLTSGFAEESTVGTNLLWLVEKDSVTKGGRITIGSDMVTLRDLNTGLYMRLEPEGLLLAVENREDASLFSLGNSVVVGADSNVLMQDSAVNLSSGDFWVGLRNKITSEAEQQLTLKCEAKGDRGDSLSLLVSMDLFQKVGISLHLGVSAASFLRQFVRDSHRFRSKPDAHMRQVAEGIRKLSDALESLCRFLALADDGSREESLDLLLETPTKEVTRLRQSMMREQGVLDVLLEVIELCRSGLYDNIRSIGAKNDIKRRPTKRESFALNNNDEDSSVQGTVAQKPSRRNSFQLPGLAALTARIQHQEGGPQQEAIPHHSIGRGSTLGRISNMVRGSILQANTSRDHHKSCFSPSSHQLLHNSTSGEDRSPEHSPRNSVSVSNGGVPSMRERRSVFSDRKQPSANQLMMQRRMSFSKAFANILESQDEGQQSPRRNSVIGHDEGLTATHTQSKEVAHRCLKAVLYCIVDNHENQLHIADRFPVLLNQVKDHRLAVLCVEEMLNDNLTILQTKVRKRDIDMFVDLLAESEMSVTFLRLLQSTCSCPMGVDATQRMVTYALFGTSSLLQEQVSSSGNYTFEKVSSYRSGESKEVQERLKRAVSRARTDSVKQTSMRVKASKKNNHPLIQEEVNQEEKSEGVSVSKSSSIEEHVSTASSVSYVINLLADRSHLADTHWGDSAALYLPSDPATRVMGYSELVGGLPHVWVSWRMASESSQYSMKQLFGFADRVPLTALCAVVKNPSMNLQLRVGRSNKDLTQSKAVRRKATIYKKKMSKAMNQQHNVVSISHHKTRVAEYLIAELYLVADLCLDRNYVAIGMLENLFEYDVLISMLKYSYIPHRMKAPVCRILRCLYVDREPQLAAKFPRYIRTSISLGGGDESMFSSDHIIASSYKFALIQQIISQYARDTLDTTRCDEFSAEMMSLLQALVKFGFYTTQEQINDILLPLIQVLDEHRNPKKKLNTTEFSNDATDDNSTRTVVSRFPWVNNMYSTARNFFKRSAGYRQVIPSSLSNESLGRKGEDEPLAQAEAVPNTPWELRYLAFTESVPGMTIVVLVVLLAVSIAFAQILREDRFGTVDIAIIAFFAAELLLRVFCYLRVYRELLSFLQEPLHVLDIALVAFDFVLLGLGAEDEGGNGDSTTRTLRLLRVFRLARLARAVKLVRSIAVASVEQIPWVMPERYATVTKFEVKTITNILKVLAMFHERIQDKSVDLTIKAFAQWCEEVKKNEQRDPVDIYHRVVSSAGKMATDISDSRFDHVLLDVMMYSDPLLVQEALNLLMVHKSQTDLFFEIADNIQIIYSPRIESICKDLTEMLRELTRLAEMFEIWMDLNSEDDLASAADVVRILRNIKGYLVKRNEDKSLGIRNLVLVDEEVQNSLRNLDAMSVFMLLLESLFNGGRETLKPQILEIMSACNDLIVWFLRKSEANQASAFKYISFFVDRVDDNIEGSSRVVQAILEGNRELVKQCPKKYISDFAEKILAQGHNPDFLDMYVGMVDFGPAEARVPAVDSEISSLLTSREWKKHLLLWCAPQDSDPRDYYEERKRVMQRSHVDSNQLSAEELLPAELRYHIKLLTLLSGCNLGPKLQAIYPLDEVLLGIMDPDTIFPVKRALGLLLCELLRSLSDRVERSKLFWKFLDQTALFFEQLESEIVPLYGKSPGTRIERGEWAEICVTALISFFECFELDSFQEALHYDKSRRNFNVNVKALIKRLAAALHNLVDLHSVKLGPALNEEFKFALEILDPNEEEHSETETSDEDLLDVDTKLKQVKYQHHRASVIFADLQQLYYRKQFRIFMRSIRSDYHSTQISIVKFLDSIPWQEDQVESDVRFEPLLRKLTAHLRSQVKKTTQSRSLDEQATSSCLWLLKAFRFMFESRVNVVRRLMDYSSIDLARGQETAGLEALRRVFNENGVTFLCLDLIAGGIDRELFMEAARLLISMLLKSGGCKEIQENINTYLSSTDSVVFFEAVREALENLQAWSSRENEFPEIKTHPDILHVLPDEIIVLNLLQVMCEGGFPGLKEQFREQTGNSRYVNLLQALALYVGTLSRSENVINTYLAIGALKALLRLVQGPCKGNQEQFVLHTELLVSLNRIIRASRPASHTLSPLWKQYLDKLKETIVDVLRGIIEGQQGGSLVLERVITTVDLSVLQLLVLPQASVLGEGKLSQYDQAAETVKNNMLTPMQAKYLALMQTVSHSPTKFQMLVTTPAQVDTAGNITSVQVVWNKEVHRVFFHIPKFLKELSTEQREQVMERVLDENHASHELKLQEFVNQCKILFREATHQQTLKRYGMSDLWSIKYYLTRGMFLNALAMNCLLVIFYTTRDDSPKSHYDDDHRRLAAAASGTATNPNDRLFIQPDITQALDVMLSVQLVMSFFTVFIFLVVKVPVTLFKNLEIHVNSLLSVFLTALDPLPIWYAAYFAVTVLAYRYSFLFVTALLLDWVVLDSTSQNLLLAVRYPARQLATTLVLILIMMNIFSGIAFVLYRHDVVGFNIFDMWQALKLSISYGFRGEYGVDHEMNTTLGARLVFDVVFYFIILAILRHIFFAIIVDTFGQLRELKLERDMEANNTCFICGVERHDFDKLNVPGMGMGNFQQHRTTTHKPLHYLFFILSIWQQSQEEDNGIEIFVRECLSRGDVSWFPIGVVGESDYTEEEPMKDSPTTHTHSTTHHHGSNPSKKTFNHSSATATADTATADHNSNGNLAELTDRISAMQTQLAKLTRVMGPAGSVSSTPALEGIPRLHKRTISASSDLGGSASPLTEEPSRVPFSSTGRTPSVLAAVTETTTRLGLPVQKEESRGRRKKEKEKKEPEDGVLVPHESVKSILKVMTDMSGNLKKVSERLDNLEGSMKTHQKPGAGPAVSHKHPCINESIMEEEIQQTDSSSVKAETTPLTYKTTVTTAAPAQTAAGEFGPLDITEDLAVSDSDSDSDRSFSSPEKPKRRKDSVENVVSVPPFNQDSRTTSQGSAVPRPQSANPSLQSKKNEREGSPVRPSSALPTSPARQKEGRGASSSRRMRGPSTDLVAHASWVKPS